MSARRAVGLGVLVVALAVTPAGAHDRTTSYSIWTITGREARVSVLLSTLDLSHFPWMEGHEATFDRRVAHYLTTGLRLLAGGTACTVADQPSAMASGPGRVAYEWSVTCPPTGALEVRSDLFFDLMPSHLHFARVSRDGSAPLERVLTEHERSWALSEAVAGGTSFLGYVRLGIEHILTGYDHLAFVVALLLVGTTLGAVARVVTGFTVAHSLTLALAVLGYVRPSPAPIEALVGLSIALVAAENIWLVGSRNAAVPAIIAGTLGALAFAAAAGVGRVPAVILLGLALFSYCYFGLLRRLRHTASLRWAVAFLFGLVHGFAFASVLVEAQLDTARLARALLGFNLGVEAGQLAVVALVWPLFTFATRHRERTRRLAIEVGSAAVLALGVFWFVSRAYR